jgi:hypothetical protein
LSEQEEFIVKKIIIASIALLAAGALPAAAQTVLGAPVAQVLP